MEIKQYKTNVFVGGHCHKDVSFHQIIYKLNTFSVISLVVFLLFFPLSISLSFLPSLLPLLPRFEFDELILKFIWKHKESITLNIRKEKNIFGRLI